MLKVNEDPERVGLCPKRLARIGPHFQRYIDDGRLSGVLTLVARRGQLAYLDARGKMDIGSGRALELDSIFRIYSMTKPVTSVAAMMLYEEGRFQLDDPISRYLPAFAGARVFTGGTARKPETAALERAITFRDLFTHTSGLTYGFMGTSPVDAMYRLNGLDGGTTELSTADFMLKLAEMPLQFQPGARWNYSMSTDVLGHLVEVISGQALDDFFRERIFSPLGMNDTGFHVPAGQAGRLTTNYSKRKDGSLLVADAPATSRYLKPRKFLSGGGGLVSTAADYLRFCHMLLNRGEGPGARLLGRKTVDYMTRNHLPSGGDLTSMGQPVFSETSYDGIGFGLGFSVMLDPSRAQVIGSPGEYAWGGMASTMFWNDPGEELTGMLLTQLMPSSSYPLRREMRVLTYQALID
ncbi:MAG: class A beta-lactamase-related serine hydrolase [Alphaproteobacteria bacterium]|nr:class A beta-lactamase-related serine hydrolase [Alphaproteobacteria bacterium]